MESLKANYYFVLGILSFFNSSSYLILYRLILTWHVFTTLTILMSNNYIFPESLRIYPVHLILKSPLLNNLNRVKYTFRINIGKKDIFKGYDIYRISSDSFQVVTSFIAQLKQLVSSNLQIPNCQTISNHLSYQGAIDHETYKEEQLNL